MNKNQTLLSKWWRTKSARAAFRRAEQTRKEKSRARIAAMLAKKAAVAKAAMEWEVV